MDVKDTEVTYSTDVLSFIHCNIYVDVWDAKACHFQYYKYLLQILVLMLSLKSKETLLGVQCTGNSHQYFSSKVKCYMLPGYCLLRSIASSLFSLFKHACVLSTLRTESVDSDVAWDVHLSIFPSVLCVTMSSVKEEYIRMNVDTWLSD